MVKPGRGRPAIISMVCAAVLAAALAGTLAAATPAQAATGTPAKFVPFGPSRIVDTRQPGQTAVEGAVADNTAVPIRIAGVGGVPTGVSAVVVNLTVVNTTGAGYVQAFPTGQAAIGSSSNLNVVAAGQILSSLVVVPVGDGGRISVYQQKRADLVIDVFGYFLPSTSSKAGRYVSAAAPARLVDSRNGTGLAAPGKLAAGDTRVVPGDRPGRRAGVRCRCRSREPDDDGDRWTGVPHGHTQWGSDRVERQHRPRWGDPRQLRHRPRRRQRSRPAVHAVGVARRGRRGRVVHRRLRADLERGLVRAGHAGAGPRHPLWAQADRRQLAEGHACVRRSG